MSMEIVSTLGQASFDVFSSIPHFFLVIECDRESIKFQEESRRKLQTIGELS